LTLSIYFENKIAWYFKVKNELVSFFNWNISYWKVIFNLGWKMDCGSIDFQFLLKSNEVIWDMVRIKIFVAQIEGNTPSRRKTSCGVWKFCFITKLCDHLFYQFYLFSQSFYSYFNQVQWLQFKLFGTYIYLESWFERMKMIFQYFFEDQWRCGDEQLWSWIANV